MPFALTHAGLGNTQASAPPRSAQVELPCFPLKSFFLGATSLRTLGVGCRVGRISTPPRGIRCDGTCFARGFSMHLGRCAARVASSPPARPLSQAGHAESVSVEARLGSGCGASASAATRSSSAADSSRAASSSASYSASSNCMRTFGGCATKARARSRLGVHAGVRPAAQTVDASNVLCVVAQSDAIANPPSGAKRRGR